LLQIYNNLNINYCRSYYYAPLQDHAAIRLFLININSPRLFSPHDTSWPGCYWALLMIICCSQLFSIIVATRYSTVGIILSTPDHNRLMLVTLDYCRHALLLAWAVINLIMPSIVFLIINK